MLRLADYLLMNYQSDVRVSEMINNLEIMDQPLANPDGTYGTGDLISSPIRFNANGYDLNRNFRILQPQIQ
jgi:murein tripeptide amidase MpaA